MTDEFCLSNEEEYIDENGNNDDLAGRKVYTARAVKEFIKKLKEEFKSALCRVGFTDNSNQNKCIRMEAFDTFEDEIDKLAGD